MKEVRLESIWDTVYCFKLCRMKKYPKLKWWSHKHSSSCPWILFCLVFQVYIFFLFFVVPLPCRVSLLFLAWRVHTGGSWPWSPAHCEGQPWWHQSWSRVVPRQDYRQRVWEWAREICLQLWQASAWYCEVSFRYTTRLCDSVVTMSWESCLNATYASVPQNNVLMQHTP